MTTAPTLIEVPTDSFEIADTLHDYKAPGFEHERTTASHVIDFATNERETIPEAGYHHERDTVEVSDVDWTNLRETELDPTKVKQLSWSADTDREQMEFEAFDSMLNAPELAEKYLAVAPPHECARVLDNLIANIESEVQEAHEVIDQIHMAEQISQKPLSTEKEHLLALPLVKSAVLDFNEKLQKKEEAAQKLQECIDHRGRHRIRAFFGSGAFEQHNAQTDYATAKNLYEGALEKMKLEMADERNLFAAKQALEKENADKNKAIQRLTKELKPMESQALHSLETKKRLLAARKEIEHKMQIQVTSAHDPLTIDVSDDHIVEQQAARSQSMPTVSSGENRGFWIMDGDGGLFTDPNFKVPAPEMNESKRFAEKSPDEQQDFVNEMNASKDANDRKKFNTQSVNRGLQSPVAAPNLEEWSLMKPVLAAAPTNFDRPTPIVEQPSHIVSDTHQVPPPQSRSVPSRSEKLSLLMEQVSKSTEIPMAHSMSSSLDFDRTKS